MHTMKPGDTCPNSRGEAHWPTLSIPSAQFDEGHMASHNCGPTQDWALLAWAQAIRACPVLQMPPGWVASAGFMQGGSPCLRMQGPERYTFSRVTLHRDPPEIIDHMERESVLVYPTPYDRWMVNHSTERITVDELATVALEHARTMSYTIWAREPVAGPVFVLGSRDREMDAIAALLRERSARYVWGLNADGERLAPGQDAVMPEIEGVSYQGVECAVNGTPAVYDHHGERDEARWPPERAWEASSLGQVWEALSPGEEPPQELRTIAALDHCLAAACAGLVPGVPMEVAREAALDGAFRTFASGLTRTEFDAAIETSRQTLLQADGDERLCPQGMVADLTHLPIDGPVVAATGEQYPSAFQFGPAVGSIFQRGYIARIRRRDGLIAIRIGGCGTGTAPGEAPIRRWLDGVGQLYGCFGPDAARPNNLYGSPERGFAGGTLAEQEAADAYEESRQADR